MGGASTSLACLWAGLWAPGADALVLWHPLGTAVPLLPWASRPAADPRDSPSPLCPLKKEKLPHLPPRLPFQKKLPLLPPRLPRQVSDSFPFKWKKGFYVTARPKT